MTWKHLKETLQDPSVWRDIYKDLVKDVIKYVFKGAFWLSVGFWLGSKLDPTIALAWDKVTGAFGPAWQALWKPLGVPRLIALAVLVAAVAPPLLRWWRSWREGKEPHGVVVKFVPPPPAPPPLSVSVFDLDEKQQKLLTMLWRIYPQSIELRVLLHNFELTYPALERLVESVEKYELVTITQFPTEVVLTKRGRDFCHESGLAVDR
jgi:hypothetical protein